MIRCFRYNPEVVGHKDDRHSHLSAQLQKQIQNLRLNRHIQRGCGFIRHQHRRTARNRHCDHDSLLHSAGKLMRVPRNPVAGLRYPDPAQELDRLRPGIGDVGTVQGNRFGNLFADTEYRIQRNRRLLKNVGDLAAADLPQFPSGKLQYIHNGAVALLQHHFSCCNPRGRLRQKTRQRHA